MWRAIGALACAVLLLTVPPSAARAQVANGQIAAVIDDRLVTLNPDGSGLRPLFSPARPDEVSGLAWSPDGNRLAFAASGRILSFDLLTRRITMLTNPLEGTLDIDPGWSHDGQRIVFRRVEPERQLAISITRTGSDPTVLFELDPRTTGVAWHPLAKEITATPAIDGRLQLFGLDPAPAVTGSPAWSPDGERIAFANDSGLHTIAGEPPAVTRVTGPPAGPPRWAPDGSKLLFATGTELRMVGLDGGQPQAVRPASKRALAPAWQPCVKGVTVSCESVAPPTCTVTATTVTTQENAPVDLPPPPCSDPAGRPLTLMLVKAPDHGQLNGRRFTPAPGFVGQDSLTYRMSNGSAESELVRLTIFVVPRPRPVNPQIAALEPPLPQRAPYLTAIAVPRLDARRHALVRLRCDLDCTFSVRLSARLRSSRRTLKGPLVRRSAPARGVIALRLRLPRKPKGRLRYVWVVGNVRSAAGVRSVKIPVRLASRR
jgi:hypothetical protein